MHHRLASARSLARSLALLSFALLSAAAAGCGSKADELTQDGVDALADCDIRTAHQRFADAHDDDPDHPQAALGFALTDLALLPEDPAVTAALADLGFTEAIDMQALVFGEDGVLARYGRGDTCESIEDYARANVPYPPLLDDSIDPLELIDADLTAGDLLARAEQLDGRLAAIAAALATAASGMTEPVEVEGGCGLGQVTFQSPELYAAAAIIELVRGAVRFAGAYDWEISVRLIADDSEEQAQLEELAAALNDHVGHLVDADRAADAPAPLTHAADLVVRAAEAAEPIQGPVDGGLFDWSQMPDALLGDLERMAASIGDAIAGPAEIADITPALTADASALFSDPIDLSGVATPLFVVYTDDFGSTLELDETALEPELDPMFTPSVFGEAAPSYEWAGSERWDAFDGDPVIDPSTRYEDVFTCASGEPL